MSFRNLYDILSLHRLLSLHRTWIGSTQAPELSKSATSHDHSSDQEYFIELVFICSIVSKREESFGFGGITLTQEAKLRYTYWVELMEAVWLQTLDISDAVVFIGNLPSFEYFWWRLSPESIRITQLFFAVRFHPSIQALLPELPILCHEEQEVRRCTHACYLFFVSFWADFLSLINPTFPLLVHWLRKNVSFRSDTQFESFIIWISNEIDLLIQLMLCVIE